MEHAFYYRLSNILWKAIVCVIVALAMFVSFGRFIMSNVGSYGDDILARLNQDSPFFIEAREVNGEWHSFTPEIVLTDLRLTLRGSHEQPLELAEGRVAIDVWHSLRTASLQTFRLRFDRLSLRGALTGEGKILVAGIGDGDSGNIGTALQAFLLNIEQLNLTNNELLLDLPDGSQRLFDLNLALRREGSFRRIEARLIARTSGTRIAILARGLGNPTDVKAFSGNLYIKADNPDLNALQQFLPRDIALQLSGDAALQAWLAWENGEPSIEAEVSGNNLVVENLAKGWRIPIDQLSLKTSLQHRTDHWTVFGSDLVLSREQETLELPRFQFDVWGDSLRLRAEDIPLAPLNKLVLDQDLASGKLAEVFKTLDPRGQLQSLEVSIADFHAPAQDWELKANFSELAVQSWRGAPGVTSAGGYAELQPGGGFVLIDSHQFTMDFPTVYREPLRFDDLYGTIDISWTSSDVILSSGLILAEGIEGTATAMFGLTIPLQKSEVGLEMDLLVGLQNTHPIHRMKYLPYTLNDALLGWLRGSVGEGNIEQGAFLWRGSLRRGASALRTVQLFFNVADTRLNYYPQWPALSDLEGTVLIDDTQVSVWSEKAKLHNSSLSHLSAEAWLNDDKQMMLAIAGTMRGDAADGLQVINESPIANLVGGAFSDWTLSGELDTRLDLELNLTTPKTPVLVQVDTQWRDVQLSINPGKLTIDSLTGQLAYSSHSGFSSTNMVGSVWGRALQAEVRQTELSKVGEAGQPAARRYHPSTSTTEVAISSRVDMADVTQWLNLDMLSLAQGETAVDLLVEIPPGLNSNVTISTDLDGVSLDLPDPWRKPADTRQALNVVVPLSGDDRVLSLDLDNTLYLDLLLSGEVFGGVSLGFQRLPEPPRPGVVHLSGQTAVVDEAQWQEFLDKYIYTDLSAAVPDVAAGLNPQPEEDATPTGLEVQIEQLGADTLRVFGQTFNDVVFSVEIIEGMTQLLVDTDWLSGELLYGKFSTMAELSVAHLDLSAFDKMTFETTGMDSFDLPDTDVVLKNLSYENEALGELAFTVRSSGAQIRVEDVVGSFAALELPPEQPGSLVWTRAEEGSHTELNAQLQFRDLGQTLQQLDYQNILETSSGQFDLDLEWPGGPTEYSLASAQGVLRVEISEGRFLDTPVGASDALRVVGILNLAHIVQRLSLDLSDMFESGIPFHNIDGEVYFHSGSIEVPKMDVKGRSSSFQFTAVSDIETHSLDGELIATLPVANNLPWVAALAMGLPVAAGVFVVSKVFEKQVNRFSSAVYQLNGSWEEPQVKFDRIFDTSSSPKVIVPEPEPEPEQEPVVDATDDGEVAEKKIRVDEDVPQADEP